jgi:hypothetical protein
MFCSKLTAVLRKDFGHAHADSRVQTCDFGKNTFLKVTTCVTRRVCEKIAPKKIIYKLHHVKEAQNVLYFCC